MIESPMVWVDCEMTGLDVDACRLLEIAVVVTDGSLDQVVDGPEFIIHQPVNVLNDMNEWCKGQFGWRSELDFDKDNLASESLNSTVTETDVDDKLVLFLESLKIEPGTAVITGNTVHMDKRFLDKYLPKFSAYLHYRLIDVSTVKELARRWNPHVCYKAPRKKTCHRAKEDIQESLAELKYYKESLFLLRDKKDGQASSESSKRTK